MSKLFPDLDLAVGQNESAARSPAHRLLSTSEELARSHGESLKTVVESPARRLSVARHSARPRREVNVTSTFCKHFISHTHYREALRQVDVLAQTTDEIPKKTFPRDSAIMAKCCSAFVGDIPRWGAHHMWSTNSQTDREESTAAVQHISMHVWYLAKFLSLYWPKLLATTNSSFVLVTGLDDDNVPWEYFQCVATKASSSACPGNEVGCRLRNFLSHPRLLHWYTQNLDIVPHPNKRLMHATDGVARCRTAIASSRRDSNFTWRNDRALMRKLSPVPIGLRIHTGTKRAQHSTYVCTGEAELHLVQALQGSSAPLDSRRARVLAAFGPERDRRAAALRELRASNVTDIVDAATIGQLASAPGSRDASRLDSHAPKAQATFWRLARQYAFVATPASHGQDTHRFWEALYLGAIPIVLTGPLDGMYRSFPCVIVQSWADIDRPGQLERWLTEIKSRVWDPRLLTSSYYADRIQRARPTFPRFFEHAL